MSFEDRLDVPDAKSERSSKATRRPRRAASRATPAPVIPPPITRSSTPSFAMASRSRARVSIEKLSIPIVRAACRRTRSSGRSRARACGGFPSEVILVAELVGERQIVDNDAIGQGRISRAAVLERRSVVVAEERVLLGIEPEVEERLIVGLVLDDDGDVLHARPDLVGDLVHGPRDQLAKACTRDPLVAMPDIKPPLPQGAAICVDRRAEVLAPRLRTGRDARRKACAGGGGRARSMAGRETPVRGGRGRGVVKAASFCRSPNDFAPADPGRSVVAPEVSGCRATRSSIRHLL